MPYNMSDMAAGSSAVRTLQENYGAAPYAAAEGAAKAQEAGVKLEQEQLNVEKTRLNNLVADTNFKATEDSRAKLQELTKSKEWTEAKDSDRLRMMSVAQMKSNDVEGGYKTLLAAESYDAKEAATEAKKLANADELLAKSYAILKTASPEQVDSFFAEMPKDQQDTLMAKVGPGVWQKMSTDQKKQVTETLFLNTRGQLQVQKMAADLARTKEIDATRVKVAEISRDWHVAVKNAGRATSGSGKGGSSSKDDITLSKKFADVSDRHNRSYQQERKLLTEEVNAATKVVNAGRLFGWGEGADKKAADKAQEKLDNFEKKNLEKEYELTTTWMPNGPTKDRILGELEKRAKLLGMGQDEEEVPNPKVVTKNKPTKELAGQDKAALDWANANPNDPRAAKIKQRLGV
jgi:hypothetical protein